MKFSIFRICRQSGEGGTQVGLHLLILLKHVFKVQIQSQNRFILSISEPENVILWIYTAFFKFKFEVQIVLFCQCLSLKVSFYAFEISFSSSNSKSKITSFFQVSSLKMSFYAFTMCFSSSNSKSKSFHFSMFEPKNVILCI